MIVGFFERTIDGLKFFKESVALYPSFDYVFYADTRNEEVATSEYIKTGVEWLSEKKVEVIVLGEGVKKDDVQLYTSATVLHSNELFTYLDEMKTSFALDARGTLRHIHVTEHSTKQDAKIAEYLQGIFIEENN